MGSVQLWDLIGKAIATNMDLNACICAKQHKGHWLCNLTLPCVIMFWACISGGFSDDPRNVSILLQTGALEDAVGLHWFRSPGTVFDFDSIVPNVRHHVFSPVNSTDMTVSNTLLFGKL